MRRLACVFVCVFAAAACRVGPEHTVPEVNVSAQWTEAAGATSSEPARTWWSAFEDLTLDALVERALVNNFDVRIATSRIREARAIRSAIAGRWDPALNAQANLTRSSPSETTASTREAGAANLFDVGFDAAFEVDLFGRRDHAIEAADAGVDVAIQARRDAVVTITAEVARNYVELRGVQRQIALTRSNLELQRDTAELTRQRFEAGLATDFDVARAESQVATTAAGIPRFEARARGAIHALSVLIGDAPGALSESLASPQPIPTAPSIVDAGLPSELLRRRPDIRFAERELARATAETGEAIAALYPSFSLNATLGRQSRSFADLFDANSSAWSAGGSLAAPILNGGTLRAQVEASEARAEAQSLAYRRIVIAALAEVESALAAVSRERARRESLAQALAADRRALARVNDLYAQGIVSFFEVLAAQRSLLASESSFEESTMELASLTVALYKALGGGWDTNAE